MRISFPATCGVAAETVLPAGVADHGIRAGVGMGVLGGREEPAQRRLDAQRFEVVAGYQVAPHAVRASVVIERHHGDAVGEQRFEHRVAVANVSVVGEGLRGAARVIDEVDPRGIGDGQRLQHQGVEHAEHHRVRADPQRQRHNCKERERRALAQHAKRIPGVLRECFQPTPSPHVSAPFPQLRRVSETAQGRVVRLFGVCAVRTVGAGLHGGMEPQFLFHLGVELPSTAQKADAPPQFARL
jgi:hypothetical protein